MGIMQLFRRNAPAPSPTPIKKDIPLSSAPAPRRARRSFDAAQISRLTASWTSSTRSVDQDIYRNLRVLVARSRDLSYNNDYAKKFLQMACTHVVGANGFALQVSVKDTNGELDTLANNAIEKAFWDWARRVNCDVAKKLSLFDIQHLLIKAVARDGEALVRKVYGKMNPYGFALQVLDIDRLNVMMNGTANNGNAIKMGVELKNTGEVTAYYLYTKHPGDSVYWDATGSSYERVPASEIYHLFIADRPEQTRGIPWMHSSMLRLQNLGGFEEAAVIAARVGASKMGFFTTPDGDGTALADGEDATGAPLTEADPGTFDVLPEGVDFTAFNPDYPHAMYGEFVKSCLRGVAAGLGVAYNTLSNDLENVNFSSIRSGTLEERDNWMVLQNWFIESFLDDLFSEWLRQALLRGMVVLENGSTLPVAKYEKFNNARWQGRRWQWVDPRADVDANANAVANGFKSRRQVIAEQGGDLDEVWTQLQQEKEKSASMQITLGNTAAPNPPEVTPPAP